MVTSKAIVLSAFSLVMMAQAAQATPIEPRSLTWNIVSDREMSRICRDHGLIADCGGMAAWDKEFRQCVIWTRSPRGADDAKRWEVLHHELRHCQDGHFHDSGLRTPPQAHGVAMAQGIADRRR
jgi:hypothetical protein